jgi:hypothetical protein
MNETTINIIITAIIFGILIITALLLDRRSKNKGDFLTGQKYKQKSGTRLLFYLTVLVQLFNVVFIAWGIYIDSWPLIIFGVILFIAVYGFSYFSRIKILEHMIAERKKKQDKSES